MKRLLLAVSFVALASGAMAHEVSVRLTCAGAAAMVNQQGAVLFDTSPTTFDRYVRDATFCPMDMVARPASIPTRDNPSCPVGYTCEQRIPQMLRN